MTLGKIREALARLTKAFGLDEDLLARAQSRYKANRKRAYKAHNQAKAAAEAADKARTKGDETKATKLDAEAARKNHVAYKNHMRAQHFLGSIKKLQRRINHIDTSLAKLKEEQKKYNHVTITGNLATGGTAKERWVAVCLASVANCATGKRRNFYSEEGEWDITHVITPGEKYGERSDCSSTVTAWSLSARLPDPNGQDWRDGYTGTLISQSNGWKEVSLAEMESAGFGYIVYGEGVGHHTEAYIGPGERTAGHGSPPVDFGVVFLFGPDEYQRYYTYKG